VRPDTLDNRLRNPDDMVRQKPSQGTPSRGKNAVASLGLDKIVKIPYTGDAQPASRKTADDVRKRGIRLDNTNVVFPDNMHQLNSQAHNRRRICPNGDGIDHFTTSRDAADRPQLTTTYSHGFDSHASCLIEQRPFLRAYKQRLNSLSRKNSK
jgi:hypothetical protein